MSRETKTENTKTQGNEAAGTVVAGANGATSKAAAKNASDNGSEDGSLLEKFFTDQLKDMYWAESHILKALSKMEEAATTEELKEAFSDHRHQTEKHVKRLEKVFDIIGQKAEAKKCEAIEGIVKEGDTIISETKEGSMTRDAALIIAAQKVEHYEIASYGGLVQLAITLGFTDAADILDKTLTEEEDTDFLLTDIAESYINMEAEEENKFSLNRKMNETNASVADNE